MFELFTGFASFLGRLFGWVWANSAQLNAARILKELLNEEEYTVRSFDVLLEKTGAYRSEPDQLRRLLLSIGARPYKGQNDDELWGFPERNKEREEEKDNSLALIGLFGITSLAVVIGLAYWLLPIKFTVRVEERFAVIEPIECDGTGDKLLSNVCYPKDFEANHPQVVRLALYANCAVIGNGEDRYTRSCCDHLREVDRAFAFQDPDFCAATETEIDEFFGPMSKAEIETWAVRVAAD